MRIEDVPTGVRLPETVIVPDGKSASRLVNDALGRNCVVRVARINQDYTITVFHDRGPKRESPIKSFFRGRQLQKEVDVRIKRGERVRVRIYPPEWITYIKSQRITS